MNFEDLTDDALMERTENEVRTERTTTAQVVQLFQEISRRKLFLKRGFPNLYVMATEHFGYCAGSAMRRINAMRLVSELPTIRKKIESGDLKLSGAAQIQSFFYAEARENRPYTREAKIELIETCLNKSVGDIQKELVRRNPELEKKESKRHTSEERVRLNFSISNELDQKIEHLKDCLSNAESERSMENLLERLVELGLEKYDPKRKALRAKMRKEKSQTAKSTQPPMSEAIEKSGEFSSNQETSMSKVTQPPTSEVTTFRSRYVKAGDRHGVALADDGEGCCYTDDQTGRRCGSTRFVELDHFMPFSHGGSNEAHNLRPMCAAHNRFRWKS